MFINQSMTKNVITITQDAAIYEAQDKMDNNKIRNIPVVTEENRLIGMVTEPDIKGALPSTFFPPNVSDKAGEEYPDIKIKDIMATDVVTVLPSYTIQDALLLLQKIKAGILPVVDEGGILRGIVSSRDLLGAFINVLGIGQPGTLIGIVVEEKVGQLKKIVDVVTEENISFGSVLVARYLEKNKRAVFIYLLTNTVSRVKKKLAELGFTLLEPDKWHLYGFPENG
jgi:acetoin utilization protein AcuB